MSSVKQLDSRVRSLIENGVKGNHRSFFVLVGDRGRDQVSLNDMRRLCLYSALDCKPPLFPLTSEI